MTTASLSSLAAEHGNRLGPDRDGAPVVAVPLQKLRFHPRNIRTQLGDLTALADSIAQEGVLVPLMAEKLPTGGLRLLHGHRRWAAADIAGLRRVPTVIVPLHTEDEAILVMLAENTGRAEVETSDLQGAVRALVDEFGWSPGAVAQRLGVPRSTISAWRAGRALTAVPARAPRKDRGKAAANPAPKIRPTVVHDLLTRWDSEALDAASLVAELRSWLGDWAPTPKTDVAIAKDTERAEPVPNDVVTQVDWLDRTGMPAADLAAKIGCTEALVWRARAVLVGRKGGAS